MTGLMEAFGVWSERNEIKGGIEYVDDIRSGWDKRTNRIDNVKNPVPC